MKLKKNHLLKNLNRIMIGGKSAYYALVSDLSNLKKILHFSEDQNIPYYVLGNGSNVLIDDEFFNGIVIQLAGDFSVMTFDCENNKVAAGAGSSLMQLGDEIAKRGYLGCTYMAVIPGTVGGAVRMNAGTHEEGEIKNHFLSAEVLEPGTGEVIQYSKEDMMFSYRRCALSQTRKIITRATFQLPQQKESFHNESQNIIRELLASRLAKQPKNERNFGSTFKHPKETCSAGWYLERVGMKGMRSGDAMVAEEHANWIINIKSAKSKDVKKLISLGQKRVFEEYGVQLEREVIYLPEDIEKWT